MAGGVIGDLTCNGTWQHYGDARQVAGGPLSSDVMKCQLKPLVRSDYGVTFTDAQWASLQATFPTGVCDYSKPGVAQQGPKARGSRTRTARAARRSDLRRPPSAVSPT